MTEMAAALADPNQPAATFEALERRVDAVIGVKLFTLMTFNEASGIAQRFHSNMPDVYPVSGEKKTEPNDWVDQVLARSETFVANSIEEIAAVFPDHELIQSLGCESCINIPVVVAGKVRGTLNCLHEAGHYTPDRIAASEDLKEPGALALLLAENMKEMA